MDTVHNQSKLVKYYDPKKVDPKYLYDGNKIKPAGITRKDPEDFDTIYGVLELWKETSANENTADPVKKDKSADASQTPDDKGNSSGNSGKNTVNTYTSMDEVNKYERHPVAGDRVRINGEFEYNGIKKDWVPVKK